MNQRQRKKHSRNLVEAILLSDVTRVKALLRAGADAERADRDGITPLYLASVNGQAELVRLLLAAGASPDTESNAPGLAGTPLCAAACWGSTETVRELLAHGADPNLREDHGTGITPLKWANEGGHAETAALLVAAGASPGGTADLAGAAPGSTLS
ncbi:ankyrin repeat domain-containing protein [Streptomyces sp. NPDC101393]|uniref:ankyrin repeat domain-containing protein n=1 Tax=Streptomyces sp. NPDC101393 TaxID=3366141 RepID=UPI0037F875EA